MFANARLIQITYKPRFTRIKYLGRSLQDWRHCHSLMSDRVHNGPPRLDDTLPGPFLSTLRVSDLLIFN